MGCPHPRESNDFYFILLIFLIAAADMSTQMYISIASIVLEAVVLGAPGDMSQRCDRMFRTNVTFVCVFSVLVHSMSFYQFRSFSRFAHRGKLVAFVSLCVPPPDTQISLRRMRVIGLFCV